MRDDDDKDWAYEQRLRSKAAQGSCYDGSSQADGSEWSEPMETPQAMSTKRRQDPPSRYNEERRGVGGRQTTNNAAQSSRSMSMSSTQKIFKVDQFPKNVKPTEQLQEWTYWLANFEMAIEKAGVTEQRARAVELALHVGDQIRRIIVGKRMMPAERTVSNVFPFYDNLTSLLDEHFHGLTDESVDVTAFNTMKQGDKETAIEFEFRLRQVAQRVNETNPAMIRTRYIDGLRDKELKDRAFIDGIPLQTVVRMATRKEAITWSGTSQFSPWGAEPVAVAAVSQSEPRSDGIRTRGNEEMKNLSDNSRRNDSYNESLRRVDSFRSFRRDDARRPGYSGNSRYGARNDSKCQKCGLTAHKFGRCPAENANCFGCGAIGHFRHRCTKQVSSVDSAPNDTDKV